MRQRFDYRDQETWETSFAATADLLGGTRTNVDHIYRFGPSAFALVLPESSPKDVEGLVKRLRREARKAKPKEGEPGGPLPAHYGGTFFPSCATTVNDLLRRAEIALRIAENNPSRIQLDGAEAPEMPPVETLRQVEPIRDAVAIETPSELQSSAPPALRILEAQENDAESPDLDPISASAEPVAMPLEVEAPEPLSAVVEESIHAMITGSNPSKDEPPASQEPESPPIVVTIAIPHLVEPYEPEVNEPVAAKHAPSAATAQPNYSADPEAIEVDEEPPFSVFAIRAPEPAIDIYNQYWQIEAPLSVIRRPTTIPNLVTVATDSTATEPGQDMLSDTLKQLESTLELIRSMKRRSA